MSLIATRLQDMRVDTDADKNERLETKTGAFNTFKSQTASSTGVISPELQAKAGVSIGSSLTSSVMLNQAGITIGSSRLLTIPDDVNTSGFRTFSFVTYHFGFTMVPSEYHNNEIKKQRDFEVKMKKYLIAFQKVLDNAALAVLEANKSQVYGTTLGYAVVADAVRVPQADKDRAFSDATAIMDGNDFYNSQDVVGTIQSQADNLLLNQHGKFNAENKSMQLDYQDFRFTNRLSDGAGVHSTFYVVEHDQLGLLFRFERESLNGGTTARTGHQWDQDFLPIVGIPCSTYYYESVGDFSAIGGAATGDMDRVMKEHYSFSIDLAFVEPYNSSIATLASPIAKFEILD